MSVEKNITMRQFNGTDYDTLYPKTDVKQIENLTPSSIGAVSKSGDTMTGFLDIKIGSNTTQVIQYNKIAMLRNAAEIGGKYCDIRIPDYDSGSDLQYFRENKANGTYNEYAILHTGNAQSLGYPKIAIGSYVGTGTSDPFGGTKQNSLTFDFEPKMLAVVADGSNMFFPGFLIVRGQTYSDGIGSFMGGNAPFNLHITWSGNTVSWWSSNRIDIGTKYPQMNAENTTYRYVALG